MTTPDPRAEVLRAAGHPEAATLLERLNALEQPTQPMTEQRPLPAPPATPEQARQAEGAMLLAAMRRDLPEHFTDATPTREAA